MSKRLEAGWGQRLAWVVLVWASLGFLVWVPFLYVAIRRNRGADWGAFVSFVVYEVVSMTWSSVLPDGDNRTLLGLVAFLTMAVATLLLLFAEFDKKTPRPPYAAAPAPHPGQPYGYPYGR